MTADIKQLSNIIDTEQSNLPLVAFGHSMGSALTQSHVQNDGRVRDETRYDTVIHALRALAYGPDASLPSHFFGSLLVGFNAPFIANVPNPTGSEWQTSDPEEIRRFQSDPLCGKPFSNSMSYSVVKGLRWTVATRVKVPATTQ